MPNEWEVVSSKPLIDDEWAVVSSKPANSMTSRVSFPDAKLPAAPPLKPGETRERHAWVGDVQLQTEEIPPRVQSEAKPQEPSIADHLDSIRSREAQLNERANSFQAKRKAFETAHNDVLMNYWRDKLALDDKRSVLTEDAPEAVVAAFNTEDQSFREKWRPTLAKQDQESQRLRDEADALRQHQSTLQQEIAAFNKRITLENVKGQAEGKVSVPGMEELGGLRPGQAPAQTIAGRLYPQPKPIPGMEKLGQLPGPAASRLPQGLHLPGEEPPVQFSRLTGLSFPDPASKPPDLAANLMSGARESMIPAIPVFEEDYQRSVPIPTKAGMLAGARVNLATLKTIANTITGAANPETAGLMLVGHYGGAALRRLADSKYAVDLLSSYPAVSKAVDMAVSGAVPAAFSADQTHKSWEGYKDYEKLKREGKNAQAEQVLIGSITNLLMAAGSFAGGIEAARATKQIHVPPPTQKAKLDAAEKGGLAQPPVSPEQALATAEALESSGRRLAAAGWRELTGEPAAIPFPIDGKRVRIIEMTDGKHTRQHVVDDQGNTVYAGPADAVSHWLRTKAPTEGAVPTIGEMGGLPAGQAGAIAARPPAIVRGATFKSEAGQSITVRGVSKKGVVYDTTTPSGQASGFLPLSDFRALVGIDAAQAPPEQVPPVQPQQSTIPPVTAEGVTPPAPAATAPVPEAQPSPIETPAPIPTGSIPPAGEAPEGTVAPEPTQGLQDNREFYSDQQVEVRNPVSGGWEPATVTGLGFGKIGVSFNPGTPGITWFNPQDVREVPLAQPSTPTAVPGEPGSAVAAPAPDLAAPAVAAEAARPPAAPGQPGAPVSAVEAPPSSGSAAVSPLQPAAGSAVPEPPRGGEGESSPKVSAAPTAESGAVTSAVPTSAAGLTSPAAPKPLSVPVPKAADIPPMGDAGEQTARGEILTSLEADPEGHLSRYTAQHGNVLNADNAATLFPQYQADPAKFRVAAHPAASWVRDELFRRALSQPAPEGRNRVVFTAGANAAGKSTAAQISGAKANAQVVFDSTLSNPQQAERLVEQALAAGKPVTINYVRRPLDDAFRGMLERAGREGRVVTINQLIGSDRGAAETARRLHQKYQQDQRVELRFFDNSQASPKEAGIELAAEQDYTETRRRLHELLDAEHEAGRISDAIYRRIGGEPGQQAQPRSGKPGSPADRGGLQASAPAASGRPATAEVTAPKPEPTAGPEDYRRGLIEVQADLKEARELSDALTADAQNDEAPWDTRGMTAAEKMERSSLNALAEKYGVTFHFDEALAKRELGFDPDEVLDGNTRKDAIEEQRNWHDFLEERIVQQEGSGMLAEQPPRQPGPRQAAEQRHNSDLRAVLEKMQRRSNKQNTIAALDEEFGADTMRELEQRGLVDRFSVQKTYNLNAAGRTFIARNQPKEGTAAPKTPPTAEKPASESQAPKVETPSPAARPAPAQPDLSAQIAAHEAKAKDLLDRARKLNPRARMPLLEEAQREVDEVKRLKAEMEKQAAAPAPTPAQQESAQAAPTTEGTPNNLKWAIQPSAETLKQNHHNPTEYYETTIDEQKRDHKYLQGHSDRMNAIQGKRGAAELRRQESSRYHAHQSAYQHRYNEAEALLGVRAAAIMQAQVEGKPLPEDKAIPAKEEFGRFFNGLNRGDVVQTPQGPLSILEVQAFLMQPFVPGAGPRGQGVAIGSAQRDVVEVRAQLPEREPKRFSSSEMQKFLYPGEEKPAPTFKAGDKVSWTGPDGKKLTGTIDDDWGDGTFQVKRDQIAMIGGRIPIGGSSRVRAESLTKVEEAASQQGAPPAEEDTEKPTADSIYRDLDANVADRLRQAVRSEKTTPADHSALMSALVNYKGNNSEKHGIKFGLWPQWAADEADALIAKVRAVSQVPKAPAHEVPHNFTVGQRVTVELPDKQPRPAVVTMLDLRRFPDAIRDGIRVRYDDGGEQTVHWERVKPAKDGGESTATTAAAGISPADIIKAAAEALRKEQKPAGKPTPSPAAPRSAPAPRSALITRVPLSKPAAPATPATALDSQADDAIARMRARRNKGPASAQSREGEAPATKIDKQDLIDLTIIGARQILRGANNFEAWSQQIRNEVEDLISAVAEETGQDFTNVLREMYGYAAATAKELGVEAEPLAPVAKEPIIKPESEDASQQPVREDDNRPLEEQLPEGSGAPGETGDAGGVGGKGVRPGRRSAQPSNRRRGNVQPGDGSVPPRVGPAADVERELPPRSGDVGNSRHEHDFRIPDGRIISGTPETRAKNNIEAIRVLREIQESGRAATVREQEILARYVGWGAVPQLFAGNTPEWRAMQDELRSLLTDEEFALAQNSTKNAHYTGDMVVDAKWKALIRMGAKPGMTWLEPAVGIGNYFGRQPAELLENAKRIGIEKDSISAQIAALLYPDSRIQQSPFQAVELPKDYFDGAVSNVPFADVPVHDPEFRNKRYLTSSVHNYFFAKTLTNVKPGGIVAFITSSFTMDGYGSAAKAFRKWVSDQADFLGAVRLPSNAFMQSSGTHVITDIIFLRKRLPGAEPAGEPWIEVKHKTLRTEYGNPYPVAQNSYYAAHPENVLGEEKLKRGQFTDHDYYVQGQLTPEILDAALARIPGEFQSWTPSTQAPRRLALSEINASEADQAKLGALFFDEKGDLYRKTSKGAAEPLEHSADAKANVKGQLQLRDLLNSLIDLEQGNASDLAIEAARLRLGNAYQKYVNKHGPLSSLSNAKLLMGDPDAPVIMSLERKWDPKRKTAERSPIFERRMFQPLKKVEAAGSPKDALYISLNETGTIDFERMEKLTGRPQEELQAELVGLIFQNPETRQWETADEYLSGAVRTKLRQARAVAALEPSFQANVAALESAQPDDIPPAEIRAALGSTWVPIDTYTQFVTHVLNSSDQTQVRYAGGQWHIDEPFYRRGRPKTQWDTARVDAHRLLSDSFNFRRTKVYDYDSESKRDVINKDETLAAQAKQRELQDYFQTWLLATDPARTDEMVRLYNDAKNDLRLPTFDGSHLSLPEIVRDPQIITGGDLAPHQKNAIWRTIKQRNVLLAHWVGTGKTFEGITAGMELKRLGLIQRPMYVVPNSTLGGWQLQFNQLYPQKRVIVFSEKDLEKENRRRTIARIATGEWDAVVVPESSFRFIRTGDEIFQEHYNQLEKELEESIREAEGSGMDTRMIKRMEKMRDKLLTSLQDKRNAQRQDQTVIWEKLGIDWLFVDEAHHFRKLGFSTKQQNIAGIDVNGNQMTFDLLMKMRHVQKFGRGVVFATATPVVNTIGEMYSLMRYLIEPEMQARGIGRFDEWSADYARTIPVFEPKVEGGGYRMKDRFAKIVNVPELAMLFRSFADVVTSDMVNLKVPSLAGGARKPILTELNEDQKLYLEQDLRPRGASIRADPRRAMPDNMLAVYMDAEKMALDARMVMPHALDDPGSRLNQAADTIYRDWQNSSTTLGAQIVFCDLGKPSSARAVAERGQFSVYDELIKKLVKKGIPEDQIAHIYQAKNKDQRARLFQQVNDGKVRIILGSTKKLGEGVNIQNRVYSIHHLDLPHTPAELDQREGRGLRQGNQHDDVRVYYYMTRGSLDELRFANVVRKAKFITAMMQGKATVREAEDVGGMIPSLEQFQAATSGDPRVLRKMEVDAEVQRLEAIHYAWQNQRWGERRDLANIPSTIERAENTIRDVDADIALREASPQVWAVRGTSFEGKTDDAAKAFGDYVNQRLAEYQLALTEAAQEAEKLGLENADGDKEKVDRKAVDRDRSRRFAKVDKQFSPEEIATYAGFRVILNPTQSYNRLALVGKSRHYSLEIKDTWRGTLASANYTISHLGKLVEESEETIKRAQQDEEQLRLSLAKPWAYEQDFGKLLAEQKELTKAIGGDTGDTAAAVADDNEEIVDQRVEATEEGEDEPDSGPASVQARRSGDQWEPGRSIESINPDSIVVPQAGSQLMVEDVQRYLQQRVRKTIGQIPLGAPPQKKMARILGQSRRELKDQLARPNSGLDWYDGDTRLADSDMAQVFPELAKNPTKRIIQKAISAALSPGQNPRLEARFGAMVYEGYRRDGRIPLTQPAGQNWPGQGASVALAKLQQLLDIYGEKKLAKFFISYHPAEEIRTLGEQLGMSDRTVRAWLEGRQLVLGAAVLGPKVGRYFAGITGLPDDSGTAVDVWIARNHYRQLGHLFDSAGAQIDAPLNAADRAVFMAAHQSLGDEFSLTPRQVQSVLWHYEQELYRRLGLAVNTYLRSHGTLDFIASKGVERNYADEGATGLRNRAVGSPDEGRGRGAQPDAAGVDGRGGAQLATRPAADASQLPRLTDAVIPAGNAEPTPQESEAYWGGAAVQVTQLDGIPVLAVNNSAMDIVINRIGKISTGEMDTQHTFGIALVPREWGNILLEAKLAAEDGLRPGGFDAALVKIASSLQAAVDAAGLEKPVLVVQTGERIPESTLQQVLDEELNHAKQMELPGGLAAQPVHLLDDGLGAKAQEGLIRRGYRRPNPNSPWYDNDRAVMMAEVGVRLMTGLRYNELNLTAAEAHKLAHDYAAALIDSFGDQANTVVERIYDAYPKAEPGGTGTVKEQPAARNQGDAEGGAASGRAGPVQDLPRNEAQPAAGASAARSNPADPSVQDRALADRASELGLTISDEPGAGPVLNASPAAVQARPGATPASWSELARDVRSLSDDDLRRTWRRRFLRPLRAVQGQGNIPADIADIAEQIAKDDDWELLRDYIEGYLQDAETAGLDMPRMNRTGATAPPPRADEALGAAAEAANLATKRQIKMVRSQQRSQDMPDWRYREILKQETGKTSTTELTGPEVDRVMERLVALGVEGIGLEGFSTNLMRVVHSPSWWLSRSAVGERIYQAAERSFFEQERLTDQTQRWWHKANNGITKDEIQQIGLYRDTKQLLDHYMTPDERIAANEYRIAVLEAQLAGQPIPPAPPEPAAVGKVKRILEQGGENPAIVDGIEGFLSPKLKAVSDRWSEIFEWTRQKGVEAGFLEPDQRIDTYLPFYYDEFFAKHPEKLDAAAADLAQELGVPERIAAEILRKSNAHNVKFGSFDMERLGWILPGMRDPNQRFEIYSKGFARKVAVTNFLRVADALYPKIEDPQIKELAHEYINQYAGRPIGYHRPNAARVAGWLTGIQYIAKIGFNLWSPVLNLTQTIVNTMPKVGVARTLSVMHRALPAIVLPKSMNPFVKDLVRLQHAGILDTFSTKFERPRLHGVKESIQEAASFLFNKAEQFNRATAYLAGLEEAKAKGLKGDAAVQHAREVVRLTQFFAGRLDAPLFSRTPTGKVLMQFKTFTFKEIEFIRGLNWKQQLKFVVATLLLGGPAAFLIVQALQTFMPNSPITKKAEDLQKSLNLAGVMHAQKIRDQFGVFTIPGLEDLGDYDYKDKILQWAAGPTVNAMLDTLAKAGRAVKTMGPGDATRTPLKQPSSPVLRAAESPYLYAVKGLQAAGVDRGAAEQFITSLIRGWTPGGAQLMRVKKAMDEAKSPAEAARILSNFVEKEKVKSGGSGSIGSFSGGSSKYLSGSGGSSKYGTF